MSLFRARPAAPDELRPDGNIFALLRLVLASAVVWSHAYVLLDVRLADPSLAVLPFPASRLAVLLFFTLSGYLVTPGLARGGIGRFVRARLLRLVPALWVMIIVTSLIVTTWFMDGPLWPNPGLLDYVWRNLAFQPGGYVITGAFGENPMRTAVNGSLWTLSREMQCYVLLVAAGALGLLARRWLLAVLWLAAMTLHMILPRELVPYITELRWLGISFGAGVMMALWRETLPLSPLLALLMVAGALALPAGPWAELLVALTMAYGLVVLGLRAPGGLKRLSARLPDYSYGLYIYAFPAQQIAIALGLGLTPYANMVSGMLLALPFAALSWHLVEKPALGLRHARKPGPGLSATESR